ncbi:MAG: amino acid adenylation domain-containing protein, partial [Oleiphilaceae bacterium]
MSTTKHLSADSQLTPLSSGQKALWLLESLDKENGLYNGIYVFKVLDQVNEKALAHALQKLVDRHPAMRTVYKEVNGEPFQQIIETMKVDFGVIDISNQTQESIDKTIYQETRTPFNLKTNSHTRWRFFNNTTGDCYFTLVLHHGCSDLWSVCTVMNELSLLYPAIKNDIRLSLLPISKTYNDYIEWQNNYITSDRGKSDLLFWKDQLKDEFESLNLATDLPRPKTISSNSNVFPFYPKQKILDKLKKISLKNKLSPFALYLGLFHLLLHKLSSQEKILVGTPTAGRDEEFGGIYGYFVSPVVTQSAFKEDQSLAEFINNFNLHIKEVISHQDYPFSKLIGELNTPRDPSRSPLFQATFTWDNANRFENRGDPLFTLNENGNDIWHIEDLKLERIPFKQQWDYFDINLKMVKLQNSVYGIFEYNTDLFLPKTIAKFACYYEKLLSSFTDNPNQSLRDVSILSLAEKQEIISNFNQTKEQYNHEQTFVELFENTVIQSSNAIAIDSQNENLTYAELNNKANQLARLLISKGIQTETIVGISLERSPEMVISLLGILKAGGAYLPLDPDYPKERLEFMIQDSQAPFVITSKKHHHVYTNIETKLLYLDELQPVISSLPIENLPKYTKPNNLAYVIYTSGSTGKPKGVQIEHSSLMNLTVTQSQAYNLNEDDNILLFSSLNFDASIFAITSAFCSRSSLHITSKDQLLGDNLSSYLNNKRISWVLLPPSIASTLSSRALPNLKTLIVGGEACSQSFAEEWSNGRTLINAYGPTESTVWATYCILDGKTSPPIGKPVANTQTYILDANLNPVPTGVSGELHIGGDGLARGYLNQPELTAEKFISNPFSEDKSARLYKSGDLARYLPDGNIEFLGRLDHQIKIRGFRVELGEIEETLVSHSMVKEALVMARNDMTSQKNGEALLAAYVITNDSQLEISELKDLLKEQLPDYMMPSGFVLLDAFPLTPNEKIDRKALPIPALGSGKKTGKQQLPRNEIEKIIAGIWQEVLNLSDVSTDENFFDLGGHSLLLAQVHSKFPKNLKAKITMVDLFKYPTIHALAHYLEVDEEEEDTFFLQQDEHIERMRIRRRLLENIRGLKIAIVGMSGRFPGAENVDEFWQNIIDKKESIRFYSKEELLKAGVSRSLINDPNYVPAKGAI